MFKNTLNVTKAEGGHRQPGCETSRDRSGTLQLGSRRLKRSRHSLGGGGGLGSRETLPRGVGRTESTKIPPQGPSRRQSHGRTRRAKKPDKPGRHPVKRRQGTQEPSEGTQGPRDPGSGRLLTRQCGPGAGAPAGHRGAALPPGAGGGEQGGHVWSRTITSDWNRHPGQADEQGPSSLVPGGEQEGWHPRPTTMQL